MKMLSPTAILGYEFPWESFDGGMASRSAVIAVDAGSTDPGPAYLGMGKSFVDRAAVIHSDVDKEFLRGALRAGRARSLPFVLRHPDQPHPRRVSTTLDLREEA